MPNGVTALKGAVCVAFLAAYALLPSHVTGQTHAMPSEQAREFLEQNTETISHLCTGVNGLVEIQGQHFLCVTGKIEAGREFDPELDFQFAYVDSMGGDRVSARHVAREIFENRAYLMVGPSCFSACANYIVPSARAVFMVDGAIIFQHGTKARDSFARAVFAANRKTPGRRPTMDEIEVERNIIEQKSIVPEVLFFSQIWKNESYLTRQLHVKQTLDSRPDYKCSVDRKRLMIILGPKYFEKYRIRTLKTWFPPEVSDYASLLDSRILQSHVGVFDFEEHPFWVPEFELVSSADCTSQE